MCCGVFVAWLSVAQHPCGGWFRRETAGMLRCCWAGVDGAGRKGAAASADMPWRCQGSSGANGRAAGGHATVLAWCWLWGGMMDVAGVPLHLHCWGGRMAAGILRCCRGGVVEVVLAGQQGRRVVAAAVALSQAEGLLAVVP